MWMHLFSILTILHIIHASVQQPCKYYCLSDALSDNNCVNKSEINVNVNIHEIEGSVDFKFNFECQTEAYKIILSYSKGNCNSINDFEQHSIYTFKKIRYSNKRNIKKLEKCEKKGKVLFRNIQTGCYNIDIIDKNYIVLYEKISFWQTSYIRQKVDVLNTNTTYGSRNNGTELIFTIQNPILNSHPKFSLRFECENCPKHLSKEHPYNLMKDETDSKKLVLNPEDNNKHLNISCELEQNATKYRIASCVIFPLTVGNYNITINFIGDPYKCSDDSTEFTRIQNIVVKADEPLQQPSNNFGLIIGLVLGSICILLSISVLMLIIKLTKLNNRYLEEKTINIEVHVDNDLSQTDIKPCLLLLYARNSEDVMTTLSSFRNIFVYQGFEVFDIYDPDRLTKINEISSNWILDLISRKDIKIILFLTPSARNFSDLPPVHESIDTLYPFAIKKLIQLSNNSDFDQKIFVAYFSNDVYEYPDYDLFCPHLRFRVPDDFFTLLQSILNTAEISLNNKSNNEYNKVKQNYEKNIYFQENVINHM